MKRKNTQGTKMKFKYIEYCYKWKNDNKEVEFYPIQKLFLNPDFSLAGEELDNFSTILFLAVYSDINFFTTTYLFEDKNVYVRKNEKYFIVFAKKGKKVKSLYNYSRKIKEMYPEEFI